MIRSQSDFLSAGAVSLAGPLGKALKKSMENRLKKVNYTRLVDPFRFRNEVDGAWRCEFWGKIVRSAILTWYDSPDAELLAIIRETVFDIISTQTPDGCISSYPADKQTDGWDIWGRKYVLIGLTRYYNLVEPDARVKQACIKLLDHLMTEVGPGRKNIIDCGWHDGLAASSILGAVVGVYRLSGDPRHLAYARWIADSGCSKKHNIFTEARNHVTPENLGNGKAYEMMSCFQGLSELYLEDPREEDLEAVVTFYGAVRDREIFITGVGGLKDRVGEYWYDGKFKQLRDDCGALGETCVTATWIHYCERILRLTGDSKVADELEKSFYNGVLGAMRPDGGQWIHMNPTPLAGASSKIPTNDQIKRGFNQEFDGHDCCLAQGPEALAMTPLLAALTRKDELMLNCFENMTVNFKDAVLKISGGYPKYGKVQITFQNPQPVEFELSLRIPEWWSVGSALKINGTAAQVIPGSYFRVHRAWSSADVIEMNFDLFCRTVKLEDRVAVCCGPVVLAQDSRLGTVDAPLSDLEFTDAESCEEIYLTKVNRNGEKLCDYASAGNLFEPENQLCVWFRL